MVMDFDKDGELLKALGHPIRLKMVTGLLQETECNVNDIVAELGIPQSTVSQHLGMLRNKGIIAPRRDGVKMCYRVVNSRVAKLIEILNK